MGVTASNFSLYWRRFSRTQGFLIPGDGGGRLHRRVHGAAVVGAVEQEFLQHCRIAGDEGQAQARHVGALGEGGEHDQALEAPAQLLGGLQAQGRLASSK